MDYHYLPTSLLATLVASNPRPGVGRVISSIREEPETWTVEFEQDPSKAPPSLKGIQLERALLSHSVDVVRDFFIARDIMTRLRLERTVSHVHIRVEALCYRAAGNYASVGFSYDFAAHIVVDNKKFGLLPEEVRDLLLGLLTQVPQLLATDHSKQLDRLILAAFKSEDLDK